MYFSLYRIKAHILPLRLSSTVISDEFVHRQGAAVNHRAIEDASAAVKAQIAAVVTFGDTQNQADNGQIPNFPRDKIRVFCGGLTRDRVCDGDVSI